MTTTQKIDLGLHISEKLIGLASLFMFFYSARTARDSMDAKDYAMTVHVVLWCQFFLFSFFKMV